MVRPPKNPLSRKFKKIVRRGCGLVKDEYTGEYDCAHAYGWNCDYCPCGIAAWLNSKHNEDINILGSL